MAKILIQQTDQFNGKTIVASGSNHKEALNNLLISLNNDEVGTENCFLNIVLHPASGKVRSHFANEEHLLYSLSNSFIGAFSEYQALSDYCFEHGLTLVKSTGL